MTTSKLKEKAAGHETDNRDFKGHKCFILPPVGGTSEWEKRKGIKNKIHIFKI